MGKTVKLTKDLVHLGLKLKLGRALIESHVAKVTQKLGFSDSSPKTVQNEAPPAQFRRGASTEGSKGKSS